MIKYKYLQFIIIFSVIIFVYLFFFKEKFNEYNLNKSISACVVAKKRTSESFNLQESKKFCEAEVRKQKENN